MSKYQCVRSVIVEQNRRGDRLHLANVIMPVKSLAIEKAYRPITVRVGDRTEKIPVIQAILHKVAVAAANGKTLTCLDGTAYQGLFCGVAFLIVGAVMSSACGCGSNYPGPDVVR
jgi:hypothetical protein